MTAYTIISVAIGIGAAIVGGTVVYFLFFRKPKKEPCALENPEVKVPFRLVDKEIISHDTIKFKFGFPSTKQRLGLPIGQHLYLSARIEDSLVVRPYTPTSDDEQLGYVDLVVKIYRKNQNDRFPNGGKMSQYLESMDIGDYIDFKGPSGLLSYKGKGQFAIRPEKRAEPILKTVKSVAMIAGGTGITPMFQLIQYVLKHSDVDRTKLYLVFANKSEDDILLRDTLEQLRDAHRDQFQLWYTVDASVTKDWNYSVGFVDAEMLASHLPGPDPSTLVVMCGPPPMMQYAVTPALDKLGYSTDNRFTY